MKRYKGYLIFGGFILILFFANIIRLDYKLNKINNEYATILITDSLDVTISSKFFDDDFKYTPSALYLSTSSGRKMLINAEINPKYGNEAVGINDVSEVGDRIYKQAKNDTIFIYKSVPKGVSDYYFILSKE